MIEHDGLYGSGRFCSQKCARSFTTSHKRKEINAIVSAKLKGRKIENSGFKVGFDIRRKIWTNEDRQKAILVRKVKLLKAYQEKTFDELSLCLKKRRVLEDQNQRCLWCNLSTWRNKLIVIEIDHIDGNKLNNNRDNLRGLCPNCHSQTDTWKKKKRCLSRPTAESHVSKT